MIELAQLIITCLAMAALLGGMVWLTGTIIDWLTGTIIEGRKRK